MFTIRIATRKSPLALWQAEHVQALLRKTHEEVGTQLVPLSTKGDQILDKSLSKIGGKGLFIKELEVAMQEKRADIAVHSIKDLPAEFAPGMTLAAILPREEASDALVSNKISSFVNLPIGATVGTSSLRRQSQLLNQRADLVIEPLRGNVGTRLAKLDDGLFDAIILAHAGLIRLGLEKRISEVLDTKLCMPAAGQGAIAIECHQDNRQAIKILQTLADPITTARVIAERAVSAYLGGSCTSPIAAYAIVKNGIITLRARVAAPDGSHMLETVILGTMENAAHLGEQAAQSLLGLGAQRYLDLTDGA